jgi:phosphatidylserine/phosphatidylglycerophosphate/cardiolipin synthase-like enzyme
MRVILLLLSLGLLVSPGLSMSIVEFYPDPYLPQDIDEYLVIEGTGSLDGITISDGEGGFRFPDRSGIEGRITIAREGNAYYGVHGRLPDYELYDTSPDIPDVIRGGRFQMSNAEDDLFLYQNGTCVQKISWPEYLSSREGQVHYIENEQWDPRPLFIGQSRFSPLIVENVTLTAFVSPDSSHQVLVQAISDATRLIQVNVYEFSSMELASLLLRAQEREVGIRLLLEGGPVGGITAEEHCALRCLSDQGVPLRLMQTNGTTHAKYQFNHAKYMIVDNTGVLLTSENFNDNGFPLPGSLGNRGWGVYVRDSRVAEYFQQVFAWDIQGHDSIPFFPSSSTCQNITIRNYRIEFPPEEFSGARVTTVLAPDTSALITSMIASARHSIDIEQAYIKNYSGSNPNPFLEEAIHAARRGVTVRILLDSSWFNVNEPDDNDDMAAYINTVGSNEGIPILARCADLERNNLEKIHNKGVVVDGNKVLVSSINWNEQSPSFNREAGMIIEHPGAGAYYQAAFEDDWNASGNSPSAAWDLTKIGIAGLVVCALLLLYFFRIRR